MLWNLRPQPGVALHPSATGAASFLSMIELDRVALPDGVVPYLDPTLPEMLRLARRRSGLALKGPGGVAHLWGVSHPTLLAAERRGDLALAQLWVTRGLLVTAGEEALTTAA